jgi:predicted flap endonuclease-1-like 5' DNA nuclease
MRRIIYIGAEPWVDKRLAGVELNYLTKIDMPEELAETLLREPQYSDLPAPPVPMSEFPEPEPVVWYEPLPGEELKALSGVSDSRAKWLANYGISTLADMAGLTYTDMAELAEAMPRVGLETVEGWVAQAKDHPSGSLEPEEPTE